MAYLGENSDVLDNVCPKTRREILREMFEFDEVEGSAGENPELAAEGLDMVRIAREQSKLPPAMRRIANRAIGWGISLSHELECEKCGRPLNDEHVCTYCGLASEIPVLDDRPPRFDEFDGESRITADPVLGWTVTRHDHGLGSTFDGFKTGDGERDWLFERMKDLNEKPADELLRDAMVTVKRVVNNLDLPRSIHERIAYLYRDVRKRGLTKKIGTIDARAVIGALALIATREAGVPRTEEEVLEEIKGLPTAREKHWLYGTGEKQVVSKKALRRARKTLEEELNLEVPRARPEQYIDRFVTKLGLNREEAARAHGIASAIDTSKISRSSQLIAGGIIYLANKNKVTQREVADIISMNRSGISKASGEVNDLLIGAIASSRNSSGTVGG